MLELNNVVKIYTTVAGDTAAMNGVSIKFPDTGMVFITGKSGSGKTTLLNVVGGLDGFDSGEIIIGETVDLGYVDQSRDELRADKNIWEEITKR